jgi:hypothetical protein
MLLSSIRVLSDAMYFLFVSNDLKIMANKVGFDDTAYKNTQAKPTNLRENPFNQTSPRFATFDYKIRSTFGSSQYRISVFVNENFRKPVVEGSKKSPVNVSSVRRLNITRKDKFSAPSK